MSIDYISLKCIADVLFLYCTNMMSVYKPINLSEFLSETHMKNHTDLYFWKMDFIYWIYDFYFDGMTVQNSNIIGSNDGWWKDWMFLCGREKMIWASKIICGSKTCENVIKIFDQNKKLFWMAIHHPSNGLPIKNWFMKGGGRVYARCAHSYGCTLEVSRVARGDHQEQLLAS